MLDYAVARRNMVDTQLRTYDVTSHRVLDAFEATSREHFVPEAYAALAYSDRPMVVTAGEGETRSLLQPMVLARLIQALEVRPGEKALDCAGGSGYGAAVLAALGARVVALESAGLAALTESRLAAAGVRGVQVRGGSVANGSEADAPFDLILVHGASATAPEKLIGQLADGGRLAMVIGEGRAGRAMLFARSGGVVGGRPLFDAAAKTLAEFSIPRGFSF